jgi:hypothetical protein
VCEILHGGMEKFSRACSLSGSVALVVNINACGSVTPLASAPLSPKTAGQRSDLLREFVAYNRAQRPLSYGRRGHTGHRLRFVRHRGRALSPGGADIPDDDEWHRHIAGPSYKYELNSRPSVPGDTNDTKLLASDVVTIQRVVMVAELPQVR